MAPGSKEIERHADGPFETAAETLMTAKPVAEMKGPAQGGAWVPEVSGSA